MNNWKKVIDYEKPETIISVTQEQVNTIRKELSLSPDIKDGDIIDFILYYEPFNPEFPWNILADEWDDYWSK